MTNYPMNYTDSVEYKFAETMTSQFLDGIEATPDKRPFFQPCLGVGAVHLSLKCKGMLPNDGFGHVDLGFIPNLTPAALVQALRASDGYGELCIVGALWFARNFQFHGMKKCDEFGYNVCMTVLENMLQAYFANEE